MCIHTSVWSAKYAVLWSLTVWVCSHLDGQITEVVGEIQKVEAKLAQLKETLERQKVDIRSLERDKHTNSRAFEPKVHSLRNLRFSHNF